MKRIIPILIVMVFTSCEPVVVNKYVVENQTSSKLEIESILAYGVRNTTEKDSIKRVEINPKTKSIITEYGEIGSAYDQGMDFLDGIDTLIVKMENRTLNKNIYDRKNWKYKVLTRGLFSVNEVEYKLILTEADFE